MKLTHLALTAGLVAFGMNPLPARADPSGSVVFIPDAPPPSTAPGRSSDRERDPRAWGITDEQWARFQAIAGARHQHMHVIVRLNNLRARQFKEDLTELFLSIPGWVVEDQGIYTAGTLPSFAGILIQNISMVEPSFDAMAVAQALDDAGIEPTAIFDSTQPGRVRIVIGAPPGQ